MKRFIGFVVFAIPVAEFLLNLPDLLDKVGKWVPILKSAGAKLTSGVVALVAVLPRAPDCGNCLAFYWFWPTLVSMGFMFVAWLLFIIGYARLDKSHLASPKAILSLTFVFLINLYLVQSWLLYKYSGLSFAKSLGIFTFGGRVRAAHDKNFFLHASNIYGLAVMVTYLSVVLLARWGWRYYNTHPDQKPPEALT